MDNWWIWVIVAAVIIVAIALIAWALISARRRRSDRLQSRFGPEYDQTVSDLGDKKRAEEQLRAREKRVEKLNIKPLSAGNREKYSAKWQRTQSMFVDDPKGAITDADRLIAEVMELEGYPVGDFERRTEDISVDHPQVVSNYREAHGISLKNDENRATTEELRQAMVNYRALFDDLVGAASGRDRPDEPRNRRMEPGTR
ncbi:MAG: hypothetical protein ACM3S1_07515 [Hyphomicrobiales bacterium]